jgi:ribonuclease BN (tRNA processing enzyme)
MNVEFLGTAGYHPNEARHTSCIYVPDAHPTCGFVLDAGTGFFRLVGRPLPARLHIFLTHAHLDHVAGLTFLLDVLLNKECKVTIYGAPKTVDTITNNLFDSPLFPLPFDQEVRPVSDNDDFQVCDVRVRTFPLTHPGGSLAYRFDWPDRSLAYVTDTSGDARYVEFIRGVDLLIHERNFSDNLHEVADASGHCTSEAVAHVAREAQAQRLALTHFNPLTLGDPAIEDSLLSDFPQATYAHDGLTLEF